MTAKNDKSTPVPRVMQKRVEYTLGAVREEMKKEDTELEAKMADLQFLTMENLDVSEICRQNPDVMKKVMEELQQIQHVFSPAEKVAVRRRTDV